jgi:Lrp/AsnC family transcriptional regulator for asnA, asnC and gidA
MIETDALDEAIIDALQADGRQSNREVARRLKVSEGTVRHRLKRLLDARAIRIGVVADPHRLGLLYSVVLWASIVPRHMREALEAIAGIPEVAHVSTVSGRYNALIVASMKDQAAMSDLTSTIRAIQGVSEIAVRPIVRTLQQKVHLTRV